LKALVIYFNTSQEYLQQARTVLITKKMKSKQNL